MTLPAATAGGIDATEHHASNSRVHECAGTHRTGLLRHVKIAVRQPPIAYGFLSVSKRHYGALGSVNSSAAAHFLPLPVLRGVTNRLRCHSIDPIGDPDMGSIPEYAPRPYVKTTILLVLRLICISQILTFGSRSEAT